MKTLQSICTLMLLLLSTSVFAQFSIGIKSGVTNAWEDYGDVELPPNAQRDVTGFHVAAIANFALGDRIRIAAEPGFVQRGAACVPGWNGGFDPIFVGDTKFLMDYVELPFSIIGNLPLVRDKLSVFGKAGYGMSYLTSIVREQISFGDDLPTLREKLELGPDANFNRLDHGINAGMGLSYITPRGEIFLETEYYHSLRDAERFNVSQNRSIDFSIGYLFRL